MPELIDHAVTEFLVDDLAGALIAVERIGEIDHLALRRAVIERFTIERMAEEYFTLYKRIVQAQHDSMRIGGTSCSRSAQRRLWGQVKNMRRLAA